MRVEMSERQEMLVRDECERADYEEWLRDGLRIDGAKALIESAQRDRTRLLALAEAASFFSHPLLLVEDAVASLTWVSDGTPMLITNPEAMSALRWQDCDLYALSKSQQS